MEAIEVMLSLSPSAPWVSDARPLYSFRRVARALTVRIKSAVNPWTGDMAPQWLSGVIDRIEQIYALEPGWDGAKAQQVTDAAIGTALEILAQSMSDETVAPQIVPTYDGGLQLEWHFAGTDLEIYIDGTGRAAAWFREGAREWDEDIAPIPRIAKELSLLTASYCR